MGNFYVQEDRRPMTWSQYNAEAARKARDSRVPPRELWTAFYFSKKGQLSRYADSTNKNPERDQLAADVDAFLARGGEIEVIPIGVSGSVYDPTKKRTRHEWGMFVDKRQRS